MMRREWWDGGFLAWFARSPGPWFALAWLPVLLLGPVVETAQAADAIGIACLLAIAAAHVAAVWLPFRGGPRWHAEAAVAVLAVVVVAFLVWHPGAQGYLYPLLALAMAVGLRPRIALSVVAALSISGTIAVLVSTGSLGQALLLGFAAFMAGASAFLIAFLTHTFAELDAARRRLAHVAVVEERERLARDLHDLLGHTLSVIVVKAEAIRRLAATDAEVVAEHAGGIESIGRDALAHVRAAVAGYREARLQDELVGARDALAAAGVRARVADAPPLPGAVDAVLAWIVREGVTNVLRHADAARCSITLDVEPREVTVEVHDDGRGAGQATPGSGIHGLRDRVERTPQGFRLSATVPMEAATGGSGRVGAPAATRADAADADAAEADASQTDASRGGAA